MTKITMGPWKEWFAWYPVKVVTEQEIINRERVTEPDWLNHRASTIRVYHWAWMRHVWRRRVLTPSVNGRYQTWEYEDRNVFDMLSGDFR